MTAGELNKITHAIIGAAIEVHRHLGPGLLESAYNECLDREITIRGIPFERQYPLPVEYKSVRLDCGAAIGWTTLLPNKSCWNSKLSKGFCWFTKPSF